MLTYYFYSKSSEREEEVDEFDLPLTQLLYVISRRIGWLFFATRIPENLCFLKTMFHTATLLLSFE